MGDLIANKGTFHLMPGDKIVNAVTLNYLEVKDEQVVKIGDIVIPWNGKKYQVVGLGALVKVKGI